LYAFNILGFNLYHTLMSFRHKLLKPPKPSSPSPYPVISPTTQYVPELVLIGTAIDALPELIPLAVLAGKATNGSVCVEFAGPVVP